ncbi:hypothetical protein MHYP_G00036990 [Metynnis hypsauchen]
MSKVQNLGQCHCQYSALEFLHLVRLRSNPQVVSELGDCRHVAQIIGTANGILLRVPESQALRLTAHVVQQMWRYLPHGQEFTSSRGPQRTADILALTSCIQQVQPWQGMTQEVSTSSQGLPNILIHTPSQGGGTVCWPPMQALL